MRIKENSRFLSNSYRTHVVNNFFIENLFLENNSLMLDNLSWYGMITSIEKSKNQSFQTWLDFFRFFVIIFFYDMQDLKNADDQDFLWFLKIRNKTKKAWLLEILLHEMVFPHFFPPRPRQFCCCERFNIKSTLG